MKEIKVRAWGAKNPLESNKAEMDYNPMVPYDWTLNEVLQDRDLVFMQSTGLLDKDGEEIWSGDLVECYTKSGELVYDGGHEVKLPDFYREIWSLREDGLPANEGERTVVKKIGNIYEK